jgi:glycosyltransferase involved in cell wall biosynthesis
MSNARPTLSLGIPVYNGVRWIDDLVTSILSDEFTDIELLISDNGSTDGTADRVRELAGADPRVTANLFHTNQGVQANFNWLIDHARADLFKWCAVGDLIRPGYLTTMVNVMRSQPDRVLAHCRYDFHDGTNTMSRGISHKRYFDERIIPSTTSRIPAQRVIGALRYYAYGGHFFGVHRRDLLVKLGAHAAYAGTDRVLTAELARYGRYHWTDDVLWSCFAPEIDTVDYVADYGLLDGKDYPDIERLVRQRGFATGSGPHGWLTDGALELRRSLLRGDRLRRRLTPQITGNVRVATNKATGIAKRLR